MWTLKLLLLALVVPLSTHVAANFTLARHPRYLVYPPRGAYKLVAGLAIPWMSPPKQYIAWTINFQFQYALPIDINQLQLPRVRRSLRAIDRPALYSVVEDYLEGRGLPGRSCLQRMICEANKHPIHEEDGVVGKLVQIALTPSRGFLEEGLSSDYHEAEVKGQKGENCEETVPRCPLDILGLVSEYYD
ncbi:Hypothetical predicted protein [Cloeon dipterum]|uniref:Uncharacterized protein n=1 Tax=Cloeon dipterum TaxID=197152 RepID=A0A8S1DIF5_9INSE|nr:Hypothetical predicted protein [Cloeon dipterum]